MPIKKKLLVFRSAYAQLVVIVFLPIALLAAVGAYLLEVESSRAIRSEQRTLATAAIIRFEPVVQQMLPELVENGEAANIAKHKDDASSTIAKKDSLNSMELYSIDELQRQLSLTLSAMNNNQHIQRVAIIDDFGTVVASSGDEQAQSWTEVVTQHSAELSNNQQKFIEGVPTYLGTAYGRLLGEVDGRRYWMFVDMDNEPLTIAQLKMWLGLGVTGLFTLLILLLSLNIYAKRWIAPIYDLRLFLQRTTSETMYFPVKTNASGELSELQQDLIKSFRRLYGEFQELKDYSEQTEEDLRDAFDEMEMQNILIRQARDEAISSSLAKSAFLANISHELRTPLNSIDGFINLLARHGNLTAEQDMYVQTIRKSSAHLLALVNDVLDFSKIEAGKLVLDKHEFSLYAAIYDVMDMLSPLAAEKGLRMAVMYYNDVPNTIIGDALRVKQVLTNLVGNAIKFTDVGEVLVRISVDEVEDAKVVKPDVPDANVLQSDNRSNPEQASRKQNSSLLDSTNLTSTNLTSDSLTTDNGATADADSHHAAPNLADEAQIIHTDSGMIHIAIQDTGHGISETAKSHLFKSFTQGDPSITRQYGGTGLGLVISRQLTKLMGGDIGFYENDNSTSSEQMSITDSALHRKGSTFWFSIPSHVEADSLDNTELLDEQAFGTTFESMEGDNQLQLPILRPFAQDKFNDDKPFEMLVWINHTSTVQVLMAALRPLNINITQARSIAGALEKLKEEGNRWDWVIIDGGDSATSEDRAALLKQIRLHYQGKLAIYGYQVSLDTTLLERYKALGLFQPLDKRQLYGMLDTRDNQVAKMVAPPTWQGTTVLAVDDHLPNLLVLDALLSEMGIQVITANSGQDAIEIVTKQLLTEQPDTDKDIEGLKVKKDSHRSSHIDMIFMDIQMPRMSGYEAAVKIRELEADILIDTNVTQKRLPIIALTAHGLADGKDKLIEAGIDDYVGKPISRPQLLQILQHWLGGGGEIAKHNATTAGTMPETTRQTRMPTNGSHSTKTGNRAIGFGNNKDDNNLLIVDWRDALVRSANKSDLAKQLLMMMQASIPDELQELEAAWEARDRELLAQIAHRILGASRYSGVPQIRQASQNFEDKCLLNVQRTVPSQFNKLQQPYTVLIDSLKAFQAIDLETYINEKMQMSEDKALSENDMTWKMI